MASCALALLLTACGSDKPGADAQDFAILAQAAEGYTQAAPGRRIVFPADHGAHPDYRIEWWYLTANLQDAQGRPHGAQWTLFRTAVRPPGEAAPQNPWQTGQVYMAHFALTWPDGHRGFQRYARGGDHGGETQSAVRAQPFAAWLDDWSLASTGEEWLPLEAQAAQDGFAMQLKLESDRPPVLQGDQGYSQKHPGGGGSHYYSQPFLEASGWLEIDGRRVEVSGQAWLDREWSSQFLQADQQGWDWIALHLDSGEKLMLFQLRPQPGAPDGAYRHAVLIGPDGNKREIGPDELELEAGGYQQVAGRRLPLTWNIRLPSLGRELSVAALYPDQWMDVDFPYWEGAVTADGDHPGERGVGYMELTGYPETHR
jgi:predicted secreted hydrolase